MVKYAARFVYSVYCRTVIALKRWPRTLSVFFICTLTLSCYGCGTLSSTFPFPPPTIDLGIGQIDASNQPGLYEVSGNTTLPDGTELTVSAIRELKAIHAQHGQANATEHDSYSILDRQITTVEDGRWTSTLNLWHVAADGQFQEAWQTENSTLKDVFKPLPGVTFSITLDPKDAAALKTSIERQDAPQLKAIEKYNVDGELYLQATKTQTVSLPFGSTLSPGETNLVRDIRNTDIQRLEVIPVEESTAGSATVGSRSDANPPLDAYLH